MVSEVILECVCPDPTQLWGVSKSQNQNEIWNTQNTEFQQRMTANRAQVMATHAYKACVPAWERIQLQAQLGKLLHLRWNLIVLPRKGS